MDQSLSSLTNFGLSFLVLRQVTAEAYGAFTLGIATYALALSLSRALGAEPQLVRFSGVSIPEWRQAAQSTTGLAISLAVTLSIIMAAIASFSTTLIADALLPLSLVLPGLLLQDAWRYTFFAGGRPALAFFNDLAWATSQLVLVGILFAAGSVTLQSLILAWGGAALLAAVFGGFQAKLFPQPKLALHWLREHKDLGPRFVAEVLLSKGSGQLLFYTVGAFSGLTALGILNAARVLFGPVNILEHGALGLAVPEGTRVWRMQPERLGTIMRFVGLALALSVLMCGALIMAIPLDLGVVLLGPTWRSARPLVPAMTLLISTGALAQGARMGLRILAAPSKSLAAWIIIAPVLVVFGGLGAALGGAHGAALGWALANCLGAVIWWYHFHTAYRSRLADTQRSAKEGNL